MFSYLRGKSYIAIEENAYCFFSGYEFLKIEKEIYVDWSFVVVVAAAAAYV